ncbi:MAG: protein-disulfide reductase DsbD domain-containing protein [Candidatus Solibacter sp.]
MVSNNYCKLPAGWSKTLLTFLAAGLFLPSLWAQSKEYLTVGELPKVAGKRSAAVQVKIPVVVKDGYHVNSNKPNEESLIPLKLTWTAMGALEGGAITYPKPSQEKYEFTEAPLSVYTGAFDLVANFKVAAKAQAGPGAATGKLRYQACSNRACYPPKTVDITISYQVQ